jgi:hypothetical protein
VTPPANRAQRAPARTSGTEDSSGEQGAACPRPDGRRSGPRGPTAQARFRGAARPRASEQPGSATGGRARTPRGWVSTGPGRHAGALRAGAWRVAPGRPLMRPADGAGGDGRRRRRSRRARAKTAQGGCGREVRAPAAVRRRLESEGYPARRADLCIQTDSSRRRAPAAADTEWIEGAFNKPGHRARVGGQSLRPARIELAPPKGGPTGRERSYAGAAQYPCAGHRGGRPRAAPSSTPDEARARGPGAPVVPERADNCCLGGWATPHQGAIGRSRPHPGPARQALPRTSSRGTGGKTVTSLPARVQAEIPRASPRGPRGPRASRARNSSPPGPGPSGSGVHEDQGGSVPRHVEGAVTVEVTAHGVKRIRPAGPVAARGPSTSRPTWPSGGRPPITPGAP